jgi:hypothetical protein
MPVEITPAFHKSRKGVFTDYRREVERFLANSAIISEVGLLLSQ